MFWKCSTKMGHGEKNIKIKKACDFVSKFSVLFHYFKKVWVKFGPIHC